MKPLVYGTAIRDITPQRSVMLHGYAARTKGSNGVAEPLRLGALYLADEGTGVLIVTVDAVGIHTTEVEEIAKAISKETGIDPSCIVVAASHTHFAPTASSAAFADPSIGYRKPDPIDCDRIRSAAVSAAAEAVRDPQGCRIESVRVAVPSVCFNRRTVRPDGTVETNFRYPTEGSYTFSPVDEELTAIRLVSDSGSGAVLVNYGCHPVTGGYDQQEDFYRVSSDYIHYVRSTIESAWGLPTFFTLGAAGDVVPRDRYGESRRRIGTILGESVVLADRMFKPLSPSLSVNRTALSADTILTFDPAESSARYDAELAASRQSGKPTEGFADALIAKLRSSLYPENTFEIPITTVGIGPIRLVALPFEVLSEFATRMKGAAPQSVLLSCANGYQGYLPFAYEYDRGGYEASDRSTHFKKGTADRIYEQVIADLGEA